MSLDRTANLFGALAQVIADRCADEMAAAGGRSLSSAAALSALLHFLDAPSVDMLRQVLGLTPSGTVRLLDRLEESGYIRRGPGSDGRSVTVTLTGPGRAAAQRVTRARAQVLEQALAALSPAQRQAFEELAGTILTGLIRGPGAVRWICRLCDTGVCRGAEGGCPVGNAAARRYLSGEPASGSLAGGIGPPGGAAVRAPRRAGEPGSPENGEPDLSGPAGGAASPSR